jgi:hypothetical protein
MNKNVSFRLLYYWVACASSLIFIAIALTNFFRPLLLMLGIPDRIGFQSETLGSGLFIMNPVPIFQEPDVPSLNQQLIDALPLVILACTGVMPLFFFHYWLLRRYEKQYSSALGCVERIIVLDLLTIGFSTWLIFNAQMFAATLLQFFPGHVFYLYYPLVSNQATSGSRVLAFGIPLILIVCERRRTQNQTLRSQQISSALLSFTQIILFVWATISVGGAIQETIQSFTFPYSPCYVEPEQCFGMLLLADWSTTTVGQAIVLLVGFMYFTFVIRKDRHTTLGTIRESFLVAIAIGFLIVNSGKWFLAMLYSSLDATPPFHSTIMVLSSWTDVC